LYYPEKKPIMKAIIERFRMKSMKIMVIGALFLGTGALVPLSSQQAEQPEQAGQSPAYESEFYVAQVPIERIWAHNKGYVVQYRKTPLINKMAYLPLNWFARSDENSGAPKGEVILMGSGKNWPHMTIYYKGGVMDHVRLYVRKETGHITWGNMKPYAEYDKYFEGVDSLKMDYR
jgi:hypothetical protein